MKSEIKQLDAKLSTTEITESKKAEVKKLRDLVVANEHKILNWLLKAMKRL